MTVTRPLGEVFDPLGAHLQDPYPLFARARQEEPVFWSPAVNAWVITRYEDVRAVLRDWQTFSSANATRPVTPLPQPTLAVMRGGIPMDTSGIGNSDGEDHRRLRAPVSRRLSTVTVEAAEPFIRRRAEELVDGFAADGHVEVMDGYAHPLPLSVIAHLCGLTSAEAEIAHAGSFSGNQVRFDRLPEKERTENARAFGAGPHTCLGAPLARRQLAVTLETLTRRLPGLRLAPDQDFTVRGTLITREPISLELVW